MCLHFIVLQKNLLLQLYKYIHGMIDSSQHLHHELGVKQNTVAGLPPELLLLPGESTYTQPEEKQKRRLINECSLTGAGSKDSMRLNGKNN